jgi:hypothetical protein
MRRVPDPDWFAHLKVGDVLQRRRGPYRVVRSISRRNDGRLWGVSFAIRHCSWTKRPYTVYTASDLKVFGFRYVGVRLVLGSEIDRKLDDAIHHNGAGRPHGLTCCSVRGVA